MAYKFQLGNARLSGSLIQEGKIDMVGNLDDDAKLSLNDGTNDLAVLDMDGNGAARLQLDNQDNETTIVLDMNSKAGRARFYADGGTVVQASIDAGGISGSATISGHALDIESTGNFIGVVTAGGFTIGSAAINEAELETIDSVTAGTAAASKAVVLDGSKNIATIGTIGCGAITSTGASSFAGGITPAAANGAALGSAAKEWADLYLHDGGIVYYGADQDVRLSHVADSGLLLESTNAGNANAAMLKLQLSSSSPADNDEIGKLVFSGFDDNESAEVFAQILAKSTDVSNGSEDGSLALSTIVAGTPVEFININGTAASTVTFVDGAFDVDFASHDGTNGLKLGGTLVTATAAELNYNDVTAAGVVEASKALVADSTGLIEFQDGTINGLFGASADLNALVFGADKNFAMYYDEAQTDGLVIAGLQNSEASVQIVADEADDASIRLVADQGDDAGDGWSMMHKASDNTLEIGNDIASQGTYVSHLTITPNATVGNSTAAFKGNVTVAGDLTINGSTTTVNSTTINVSSSFTFEGAANAHETVLHAGGDGTGDDPGADTTLYLPALSAGSYYIPALADKSTDASAAVTAAEFALLDGASTVGTTTIASGDGFLHNDGGTMKQTSIDKIADFFAGDSLAASSGVLDVNIDGLSALGGAGLHQTQDHFMFSDNGTEKKITFSNLQDAVFADISGDATVAAGGALTIAATSVEGSMLNNNIVSGLTDIGAAIADTDEMIVSDAGTIRRTDMSRLKTYIGAGTSDVASGSAGATLAGGINYFDNHGGAITAALPGTLSVGESVMIKAGGDCSAANKLTITTYMTNTIDGVDEIILESPFAAVECVYVVTGSWRVF
jgi:hypothetical protein